MAKFVLLLGLLMVTLAGCDSKSNDAELNQLKQELDQTNQALSSTQAELNAERDKNNQLEQKLSSIANGDSSDPDLLAVYLMLHADAMSTHDSVGDLPLLHAYVLASHLTSNMVYIKNEAVPSDDPTVAEYLGDTLNKNITSRFIRVLFNKEVLIPIYARDFENEKVPTKELLLVVDEKTNLPSLFSLRGDGKYDHYTLDDRGLTNYDPQMWFDALAKYIDRRDEKIQSSGAEEE